jgi:Fe-Mn family superoxide dismutase
MLKNTLFGVGAMITAGTVASSLSSCTQQKEVSNLNSVTPSTTTSDQSAKYPFQLPPLPFDYAALEPVIDAETMRLHHDKHHQAYVDNLNAALKDNAQFHNFTIEDLLRRIDEMPENIRTAVRNHGGGHANHQLFWKIMRPIASGGTEPTGALLEAINRDFVSFDQMKQKFNEAGEKHFGSGWVFLIQDSSNGKLDVVTRPNQDSVLMESKSALLGNDVWEHAYYLKYQNKRGEYLKAWWNTVNWQFISERFKNIRAGKGQP